MEQHKVPELPFSSDITHRLDARRDRNLDACAENDDDLDDTTAIPNDI